MISPFAYQFGYPWLLNWGHVIPLCLGAALVALGVWFSWRSWLIGLAAAFGIWGCAGLFIMHVLLGINTPMALPSQQFLASDTGRVLDMGAGSGRAAIGVLLARPHVRATAIDIYRGYYGISDNTPARLLANARIAGVEDRIDARTADMRSLPFADGSFDAVVSTYAIDHLRRTEIPTAIKESARVLKPGGELLLEIVNPDVWVHVTMPIPHFGLGAHRPPDPETWRHRLEDAGFQVVEEGAKPVTLYWIARKPAA